MSIAANIRQEAATYLGSLYEKSLSITAFLQARMGVLAIAWLLFTVPLALLRLAYSASPIHSMADALGIVLAYSLVIAAPIAGFVIARGAFGSAKALRQPSFRISPPGRWRRLSRSEARQNPVFGPVGFMASLLIGMLLNVVVRTGEFFMAVPAMNHHAPGWGQAMFMVMSMDVVVTSFFYMVAFVMALRSIPMFPRMLAFAWAVDIVMQFAIAKQITMAGNIPPMVVEPLLTLLDANITKVLISAAVWLPYLILSERVNVTYRQRLAA